MIPETFWNTIASSITAIMIMIVVYLASKSYKNIMEGIKRPIYVDYNNCTFLRPEI